MSLRGAKRRLRSIPVQRPAKGERKQSPDLNYPYICQKQEIASHTCPGGRCQGRTLATTWKTLKFNRYPAFTRSYSCQQPITSSGKTPFCSKTSTPCAC